MESNKRDAVAAKTKQKILQSARALFVKKGFDGVSISEIAKKAAVNQSLIYHYYQSKADLWKQVKCSLVESHTKLDYFSYDVKKGLRPLLEHIIYTRFDFYEKNPDIVRLIGWQKLEQTRDKLLGGTILSPDRWRPLFLELQQNGQIRSDISIDLMILFMRSMITGALADDNQGELKKTGNKQIYLSMVVDALVNSFEKK